MPRAACSVIGNTCRPMRHTAADDAECLQDGGWALAAMQLCCWQPSWVSRTAPQASCADGRKQSRGVKQQVNILGASVTQHRWLPQWAQQDKTGSGSKKCLSASTAGGSHGLFGSFAGSCKCTAWVMYLASRQFPQAVPWLMLTAHFDKGGALLLQAPRH